MTKPLPWYVDVGPVRRWIAAQEAAGHGDEAWVRVAAWERMVAEHGVVRTWREGRVGHLQLSYPPKGNAFVPPMYRMFAAAIEELALDDDVWVIVISGAGKSFSTGGYVGENAFFAGLDAGAHGTSPEPMRRTNVEWFHDPQKAIYNVEKPTIAMINGLALGEAVDIALCCDFRVGHPDSDLWFSFGHTGNTAYTGSAWLLPRLIGVAKAKHLLLTAARITGREAYEAGLYARLADDAEALESVTAALADRVASLPPITLRLIKKEIHRGLEIANYDSNLDLTSMIEPIVQFTEDHMDAERAVVEKRPPVVRGH